jgi:tRNA dimethylallyltransferase
MKTKPTNRKLIAIVGPTASGKSSLAKKLIKKFNGVAISADSRQIYRYMDIGTGKDKSFFQHMIDIRDPKDDYSVAEYQKEVYGIIDKIFESKKTPFLVGGTGLYINAVLYGYQFPKTDPKLRTKIEDLKTSELIQELKKYDPVSAENNKSNHRRLARALESYLVNSRPLSKYKRMKPNFEYLMIGIDIPRDELYQKIDARVDDRIKAGMIEEVENLLRKSISHQRLQRFGLEYREISDYLQDPTDENLKLKIENLKFRIHAFARRQITWFRKNKEIVWVDSYNKTEKIISKYLTQKM